ncbi:ABC transporter permease [Streptomyces sp. NPDC004629]|uniref:ABC transporter permease n=1 Tax=Streptomyces sp. NPDC004629 TaxID=3364705 RepID=UPI0036A4B28F
MSEAPAAPPAASADGAPDAGPALLLRPPEPRAGWRLLPARVVAMCAVELQKLRHDRTELYTRAVQPALWLLITGKAFAAGVKSLIQAVVVIVIAALLGVALSWNPLKLLGVALAVVLASAFFSCLSMTIAGIVLSRDRLMGFGQAITMPLFFGSNALYPVSVMPGWLQAVSKVNPLSYEVDALRGLLLGTPAHPGLDFGVLAVAAALGIAAASSLLGRLAR